MPFYNVTPIAFLYTIFYQEELQKRVFKKKSQLQALENSIPEDILKNINCQYYDENHFRKMAKDCNPLCSMFNLNIRSVNTHADDLYLFLENLEHKFDIIGLTAIGNCYSLNAHALNLGEYNVFYKAGNNTFSGSAILIKENIDVINVRRDISIKNINNETTDCKTEEIWVECNVKSVKENITFGIIYRQHNNNISTFTRGLENVIYKFKMKKKRFVSWVAILT